MVHDRDHGAHTIRFSKRQRARRSRTCGAGVYLENPVFTIDWSWVHQLLMARDGLPNSNESDQLQPIRSFA